MSNFFDDLIKENQTAVEEETDSTNDAASPDSTSTDTSIHERPSVNDQPNTPSVIKESLQELLKYGVLEQEKKPNLYRNALVHFTQLNTALEPLDLAVQIDDIRGIAFLVVTNTIKEQGQEDEWSHPLIRKQRLNLEQSLLIAILRQHFVAHELEAGIGDAQAKVHLDDLLPELNSYLGIMGSEAKEMKRLTTLLDQLKGYGIVSETNDNDQVTIKPLIAHLANPENLKVLLNEFKKQSNNPE